MLKRLIAISFLWIFFSANTVFSEWLKFPILLHHFIEHIQWEHSTSLIDFLAQHYQDNHHLNDAPHHDHKHLPFKTHTQSLIAWEASEPPVIESNIEWIEHNEVCPKTYLEPSRYIRDYQHSIWQPPKA